MVFMPNGNLGILQPYPGKIIQLSLTGEPASTVIIESGSSMVYNANARGDRLVVTGVKVVQEPGFQDRHSFLARIDEEGQVITRYLDHHYRFDFEDFAFIERDMHFPYWLWAMDADGRIYVAPARNRYAITVMSEDGAVERVPGLGAGSADTEHDEAGGGEEPLTVHVAVPGVRSGCSCTVDHLPCTSAPAPRPLA
jgi:hypothetical protein